MSVLLLEPQTETKTVVVIDDDPEIRFELMELLGSVGIPVETYESGEEYLAQGDPSTIGCLIVDVRMPGVSGMELQRQLNDQGVDLPLIMMTAYAEIPMAVEALKAGAVDFVEKPFSPLHLLETVKHALIDDKERRRRKLRIATTARKLQFLTPREREVLDLLVEGYATKEIARTFNVGPTTIDFHRNNVLAKMDVENVVKLTRLIDNFQHGQDRDA